MRFLDLDLDFFLNENAYFSGCDGGRLGSEYKPWSVSRVRHFLEYKCGLSLIAPVLGRTVESHDEVLNFWHALIESGGLRIPFEVVHVDAHPDLWIGDGLSLTSKFLIVDTEHGLASLRKKHVHSGNYLTFAIAYGWVGSLVWIPLRESLKNIPKWDADARSILSQRKKSKCENSLIRDSPEIERERGVPFKITPWQRFRTSETFDYIALSRSPNFTPPESDRLITTIEEYMKQI
jgi:hypothetical protein